MKNDNALKKHHFWLLLGFVPLFALLGMLMVSSSVGGKIAEREKAVKDAQGKLSSKLNPTPKSVIQEAEELVKVVASKSGGLHEANWKRQKDLFTWPNTRLLKDIEQQNLKFGAPLPSDRGEFDEFRRTIYKNQFSTIAPDGSGAPGTGMADRIAPTQFRGGWKSVLRHVTDFGPQKLTSDQVWLVMEDIWVQRSLLESIRTINEDMSKFRRAKVNDSTHEFTYDLSYDELGNKLKTDGSGKPVADKGGNVARVETPEDEKRKAAFRNRTWGIELELIKEGNGLRLGGTLYNLSNRLQLMGVNSAMTLHVWLSKAPGTQPKVFKISGESLAGKGATKTIREEKDGQVADKTVPADALRIVPVGDHLIAPGEPADEIVRVEQVFDIRTVPVKRVDDLVLGKTDARLGDAFPLLPPGEPFKQEDPNATPATGNPMTGGLDTGPTSQGPPPPSVTLGGKEGAGGFGGLFGQGQGNASRLRGGGEIRQVVDANKKRYVEVTKEVRRMPVGLVLVVDQSYLQDVLLAFANSPLRFQITQVTWTRFRGPPLTGISPTGSVGDAGGEVVGSGQLNFGGPGDPDADPDMRPSGPIGRNPGLSAPGLGGPTPLAPGLGGPPMPGAPPGVPGMYGPGSGYGTGASSVSETQVTAGLIELSVYGIVSLYEKYTDPKTEEAKKDADTKKDDGMTPKKDDGNAPKDPMPQDPMPGTKNGTPKMRRRVRK